MTDPATTIREALEAHLVYAEREAILAALTELEQREAKAISDAAHLRDEGDVFLRNIKERDARITELEQQAGPKVFRLEREARLAAEHERDQLADTLRAIANHDFTHADEYANEMRDMARAALDRHTPDYRLIAEVVT